MAKSKESRIEKQLKIETPKELDKAKKKAGVTTHKEVVRKYTESGENFENVEIIKVFDEIEKGKKELEELRAKRHDSAFDMERYNRKKIELYEWRANHIPKENKINIKLDKNNPLDLFPGIGNIGDTDDYYMEPAKDIKGNQVPENNRSKGKTSEAEIIISPDGRAICSYWGFKKEDVDTHTMCYELLSREETESLLFRALEASEKLSERLEDQAKEAKEQAEKTKEKWKQSIELKNKEN
jgi:hypothetical protein